MMHGFRLNKKGMSLPETLIAIGASTFIFMAVFLIWEATYKNWAIERVRTRLRVNLEIGMEKIKEEMRLSSATYMSGYPIGGTEYTAISFPMSSKNSSGFYTLSGGYVYWDKSVIYHIYTNSATGHKELRRTEFVNNNAVLTVQASREAQLTSVATTGDGSSATNSANATTKVILPRSATEKTSQDISLKIRPNIVGFNCYSSTENRINVSFGNINLASGYHDLKFTVTGKDASSTGYKFGIDSIAITPSGSGREVEIYPSRTTLLDTISASSGDSTSNLGPSAYWGGEYYLQYNSNGVNDYLNFNLYYDLWRESNFINAQLDNTETVSGGLYVKLPTLEKGRTSTWQVSNQTGGTETDYSGAIVTRDKTVRVLLTKDNFTADGDMARVKFVSNSASPLTITSAYLDIKDDAAGDSPKLKYDPAIPEELVNYETNHVKLVFKNAAGTYSNSITIDPANPINASEPNTVYSEWAIFPVSTSNSYFVTFHIADDASSSSTAYWPSSGATNNTYMMTGSDYADDVNWVGYTSSPDIFVVSQVDVWRASGSVISNGYDTQIASPSYNQIRWIEYKPSHSSISLKARSCSNIEMAGATDWSAISGTSANPSSLSIGNGQYVQFRADMSLTLGWTCATDTGVSVTDNDYKHNGLTTCSTCGALLVPDASIATGDYCPWIDDVTIDWPGSTRICEISAYMRQSSDYGIVSLSVDGQPLSRSWKVELEVNESFQGKAHSTSLVTDIKSLNTGK